MIPKFSPGDRCVVVGAPWPDWSCLIGRKVIIRRAERIGAGPEYGSEPIEWLYVVKPQTPPFGDFDFGFTVQESAMKKQSSGFLDWARKTKGATNGL